MAKLPLSARQTGRGGVVEDLEGLGPVYGGSPLLEALGAEGDGPEYERSQDQNANAPTHSRRDVRKKRR